MSKRRRGLGSGHGWGREEEGRGAGFWGVLGVLGVLREGCIVRGEGDRVIEQLHDVDDSI